MLRSGRSWRRPAAGFAVLALAATAACTSPAAAPARPRPGPATATVGPDPSAGAGSAAGQVMLVGTPVDDPAAIEEIIRVYGIGGVFLSGRSVRSSAALGKDIAALQRIGTAASGGVRLLVALDQEGGEVQTLKGTDFPLIPTAQTAGRLSRGALAAQTEQWAGRLAAIGVNLDLAPVADTVPASLGTGNPPIGAFHRQYGSDPAAVAAAITTVVPAIQSTGVITTLKHFPGLGRVHANTDTSAGAVDSQTTVDDPYLAPFRAGIAAGTGAVMIASASYPNLDPATIATFSRAVVTGLLRDRLGFKGLIASDALGGAAAVQSVATSQRAVRFVEAGGDLALSVQQNKAVTMIGGLVAAAQASPAFAAQLTAAATQVLRTKCAAGLLPCSPAPAGGPPPSAP
jgi:beta-N-acetylhexosaminidase